MTQSVADLYSALYDVTVPDWPGEIAFYQTLALAAAGQDVLEIACGTGRVTLPLARAGVRITGLELSAAMLAQARGKSAGLPNVTWVQGDMRTFDLGRPFGLVIIPGHSFQFMLTPDDQVQCLQCIRRHLLPGGTLVVHLDHQNLGWLGGLGTTRHDAFKFGAPVVHPTTGQLIRTAHAWTYAPATQTAAVTTVWEEVTADGVVLARWERPPMPLHCVFRCEMEHLLHRVGLAVEAVYGDFESSGLTDTSDSMIWVARSFR
jgi:SAM-dependent methyltransferase